MVSDKEHGPVFIRDDLAPHNGVKTFFFGRFDKVDQAVKAVGVGEGETVHALLCGGLAELFKGGHPPSWGVVGVDVEMNKHAHTSLRFKVHGRTVHGTRHKVQGHDVRLKVHNHAGSKS